MGGSVHKNALLTGYRAKYSWFEKHSCLVSQERRIQAQGVIGLLLPFLQPGLTKFDWLDAAGSNVCDAPLQRCAIPALIVCNTITGIHKASLNSGGEALYLVERGLWA